MVTQYSERWLTLWLHGSVRILPWVVTKVKRVVLLKAGKCEKNTVGRFNVVAHFLHTFKNRLSNSTTEQKSTPILNESACISKSEWRDSNSRPPAPKAGALPTAQHPVKMNTTILYLFFVHSSSAQNAEICPGHRKPPLLCIFALKQSQKWCIIKCIERKCNSGL